MALALGGRTVAELQRDMGWVEFLEWCDFHEIEPYGDRAQDGRIHDLMITLVNLKRKKGKKPIKFGYFIDRVKVKKNRFTSGKELGKAVRGLFSRRKKRADRS